MVLNGQIRYFTIDQQVRRLDIKGKNTFEIAQKITSPYNNQTEKIRAIYSWIGFNIEYDHVLFKDKVMQRKLMAKKPAKRIKRTLKTKSAICIGYAELFQTLAHAVEIDCEVITGYSKAKYTDIGKNRKPDHAWNVAKINGEWKLFDVTWGQNYLEYSGQFGSYDPYFMSDPLKFNYNHYPIEKYWELNSFGITKDEFKLFPLVHQGFFKKGFQLSSESSKGIIDLKVETDFVIKFSQLEKPNYAHIKLGKEFSDAELTEISPNEFQLSYRFSKHGNYYTDAYIDGIPTLGYLVRVTK